MKVSLNLKPCKVPDTLATVGEVITFVESNRLAEGHGLNRIILDGNVLELEDEQAQSDTPVDSVELIEFYSARPIDLTIEGLAFAAELLPSLGDELEAAAADLRSANLEDGLMKLGECLGYIDWYMVVVNAAHIIITTQDPNMQTAVAPGQDIEDLSPEADFSRDQMPASGPELKTFASRENLRQKLKDMEAVQQNKDHLLLADLVEYEILPIVKLWNSETASILKLVQMESNRA